MYKRPIVLANDDLAEGVFLGSGGTATAEIPKSDINQIDSGTNENTVSTNVPDTDTPTEVTVEVETDTASSDKPNNASEVTVTNLSSGCTGYRIVGNCIIFNLSKTCSSFSFRMSCTGCRPRVKKCFCGPC